MKLTIRILLLLLMLFGNKLSGNPLDIGAELPSVQAMLDTGKVIDLAKAGTEGYLLVYFYPKANTPGCTKQACSIRDAFEILVEKNVQVFGVSKDNLKSQSAFREKYNLPYSLVADPDSVVIDSFGVPKKLGFASRQAFLFKKGILVWRDLAASTSQQADDVLAFLADFEKK